MRLHRFFLLCLVTLIAGPGFAETIRVATYNVENFQGHFSAHSLRTKDKAFARNPENKEILDELKKHNDKDNWETAQVILSDKVNADVVAIEECCDQENLEYFNKRWLKGSYETVIVFPTNTDREQNLGMLIKPGFKVIQKKDQYYLEKDPVGNERGEKLFARGPSFVLIASPSGYRFWMGVTHQKSKSRNTGPDTAWRNREAVRTHEIMKELSHQGPEDVVLVGDMNDELGVDKEFEKDNGGDTIVNLVGPAEDQYILTTKRLIDAGQISFGGYWQSFHRSLIDQIIVSPTMKNQIASVDIYTEGLAPASSDHYPVILSFAADAVPATQAPQK